MRLSGWDQNPPEKLKTGAHGNERGTSEFIDEQISRMADA